MYWTTLEISAPRCALMCYPSSNITYCIACLLCIGVILQTKFNSVQFNTNQGTCGGESLNFQTLLIGNGIHPKRPVIHSTCIPAWTTLPIAKVAFLALVSCKCAKSCKGYCNCFNADLECTPLCRCAGTCYK